MHTVTHKPSVDRTFDGFKQLDDAFRAHHKGAVSKLINEHPHIAGLLTTEVAVKEISATTAKMLSTGVLASALLLAPMNPAMLEALVEPVHTEAEEEEESGDDGELVRKDLPLKDRKRATVTQLQKVIPSSPAELSAEQSNTVSRILKRSYGVMAHSELDGKRLNTDFGTMGYEQHLLRYPGDTVHAHDVHLEDGMAPKKGAFGYFAQAGNQLSKDVVLREKYYFAVQTFKAPGWSENMYHMKDWFKYKKMVAVNVKTGDAVVGVIGDAGPATWTGKQFGGSPEVMHALHLDKGMRNGDVLLMFVEDPTDAIPLGPLN